MRKDRPYHSIHALTATWLPNAPAVCPDETIGSISARYHLLSCNPTTSRSIATLFGTSHTLPHSGLPTHLLVFLQTYFGTVDFSAVRTLIDTHTLKPYFTFASTPDQTEIIVRQMAGPNGVKSHLGLPSSLMGAYDALRYCVACASEDRRQYGFSYWHRAHQLPLVSACHKHGLSLHNMRLDNSKQQRYALPLPLQLELAEEALQNVPKQSDHAKKFAALSFAMLSDPGSYSSNQLREIYVARLIQMGLATKTGRVDQTRLGCQLSDFHANFSYLAHAVFRNAVYNRPISWIERLVRKPRTRQHPVFHLLLIDFLFGSWEVFRTMVCDKAQTASTEEKEVPQGDQLAVMTRFLIHEKRSLTETAKRMNLSFHNAQMLAVKHGLPVTRKPKNLSDDKRGRIKRALGRGDPIGTIAQVESVSLPTIYRICHCDAKLMEQRKAALMHEERIGRRADFLKIVANSPAATNLRKVAASEYSWLWRNDREWLQSEMLRLKRVPSTSRMRIDWVARDQWLHAALKRAISNTLANGGRPVRITAAQLGRTTGKVSWIEDCLSKLPRSAALLKDAVESTAQFQLRRITWALHKLKQEGRACFPSTVARLAGIRSARDPMLLAALRKEAGIGNAKCAK